MRYGSKSLLGWFVVVSLVTLGGCSSSFQKDDLVGKYVLNTGPAIDSLELKRDGEYTHSFQQRGSPVKTLMGRWELDKMTDGQVVILSNVRPLPEENTTVGGYYLLRPTRIFGAVRLMKNADLNEFYKKE